MSRNAKCTAPLSARRCFAMPYRPSHYVARRPRLGWLLLGLLCSALLSSPGVVGQTGCAAPPQLIAEIAAVSDICLEAADGFSAVQAIVQYRASMTGNLNSPPQFSAFVGGRSQSCTQTGVEYGMDGSWQHGSVNFTCTVPNRNGEGTQTVEVAGFFDSGMPGCSGTGQQLSASFKAVSPPKVTLLAPASSEICFGAKSFSVLFAVQKSAVLSNTILQYDAWLVRITAGGSQEPLQYCTATESGASVAVQCDSSDPSGLPPGTYNVILKLKPGQHAATSSPCKQELAEEVSSTQIIVKPLPIIILQQIAPKPVCLGVKRAALKFEYTIQNAGDEPNLQALKPLGQLTGSVQPMATECTATIESYGAQGVLMVVCQGAYSYTEAQWQVKATLTATCNGGVTARSTPGQLAAAASAVNGNSAAAAYAATVTTQVHAMATAATEVSKTVEVTTPLSCCINGPQIIAWARNAATAAKRSTCFKSWTPGSSRTSCDLSHGFYHQGELSSGRMFVATQPPVTARMPSCNRPGGFSVGEVTAQCVPTDTPGEPDLLNITIVQSKYNDARGRRFMFTCDKPAASSCKTIWESLGEIPTREEDGRLISSVRIEVPPKCKCRQVYWALRETGFYRDGVPMSRCEGKFTKISNSVP